MQKDKYETSKMGILCPFENLIKFAQKSKNLIQENTKDRKTILYQIVYMTSEGDLSFLTQIGRGSDVRPTSPNLTLFWSEIRLGMDTEVGLR